MDTLLHRFSDKIKGVIEGFDRIVFKGMLKPLSYAAGMQMYLGSRGILNKNYTTWVQDRTAIIIKDAEEKSVRKCGLEVQYLMSSNTRKEDMVRNQQAKHGTQSGLIGSWACVESCNTFKAVFDKKAGYPQIKADQSRCKHIYFYYDHEDYGFMSVRLQTWAPYEIQIALNGREWLRRLLDKSGVRYLISKNKFLDIEDYDCAQKLLDSQLDVQWIHMLNSFLPDVFPSMQSITGETMSYTWTLWQSEWAKDYIYKAPEVLSLQMNQLLRHAFITGTSSRVLRYMGRPVRENDQPHWAANPELYSRVNQWRDGARLRHWVDKNSLKFYNEQNVLRFEFTMNDPSRFRIYRTTEGKNDDAKRFLPMRKGIADIAVRTKICSNRIKNFTDQVASLESDISVGELLAQVTNPVVSAGKRYRALDVTGKDLELLKCIADPKLFVDAITNKHLQEELGSSSWANGMSGRSLSGRISRHLRLLREHGLIKKMPNQHRYFLTDKGRLLTSALHQCLGAKVNDLSKLAA